MLRAKLAEQLHPKLELAEERASVPQLGEVTEQAWLEDGGRGEP